MKTALASSLLCFNFFYILGIYFLWAAKDRDILVVNAFSPVFQYLATRKTFL